MATTPKRLASGQITDTTLTTIYTAPTGSNSRLSKLGITNEGTTAARIDVYINDGTDRRVRRLTLPAGVGAERPYYDIQRSILNDGDIIKLQSDTAITFNYFLFGSEIEITT